VIGDGEAETGPLAASWHSNKFLEPGPRRRGAADPAPQRLQDRQPDGARPHARDDARAPLLGYWHAVRREGEPAGCTRHGGDPRRPRPDREIQRGARARAVTDGRPLADDRAAHAQGLDGPKDVDGKPPRARALAPGALAGWANPSHLGARGGGCAVRPEELFDEAGGCGGARRAAPRGDRRMGANPHANGGLLLRAADADFPRLRGRRAPPGGVTGEATRVLGATCAT
jgi:xylulose-5-phosphate/fructose-6-phosphate phosphoketolase